MSPELERERQEHLDLLCDMHNALCRLGGMMSLAKQGVFPTADWREFEPKLKALITKSNLQDPDKLERLVREDQDKISREDERRELMQPVKLSAGYDSNPDNVHDQPRER